MVRSLIDNLLKSPEVSELPEDDDEESVAFFLFGLHVDVKLDGPEHALFLALNSEPLTHGGRLPPPDYPVVELEPPIHNNSYN